MLTQFFEAQSPFTNNGNLFCLIYGFDLSAFNPITARPFITSPTGKVVWKTDFIVRAQTWTQNAATDTLGTMPFSSVNPSTQTIDTAETLGPGNISVAQRTINGTVGTITFPPKIILPPRYVFTYGPAGVQSFMVYEGSLEELRGF